MEHMDIVQERAEDPGLHGRFREKAADAVITRAALKDENMLEFGGKIVGKKGKIVLMKGDMSRIDIQKLEQSATEHGKMLRERIRYRLPDVEKERNLFVISG